MPLPRTPQVMYMGVGGQPPQEAQQYSHKQMQRNEQLRRAEHQQEPGYNQQRAGNNDQQEWFGGNPPTDAPQYSRKQMQLNEQLRQAEQRQQPSQQQTGYNQQGPGYNEQQEWFGGNPPTDAPQYSRKQMQLNEQRRQTEQQQQSPRYYEQRPGYTDSDDNRGVQSERRDDRFGGDHSGQNTWRQPETERSDYRGQDNDDRDRQDQTSASRGQMTRDINRVDERAEQLDKSVDKFHSDWQNVPGRVEGAESAMSTKGHLIDKLKETRTNNSARIHELQRAMMDIQQQNDMMKNELIRRGEYGGGMTGQDQDVMDYRQRQYASEYPAQPTNQTQPYNNQGQDRAQGQGQGQGYRDDKRYDQHENNQDEGRRKRWYDTEPIQRPHAPVDSYLGYTKYISPHMATAYRREGAVLEYAKTGELPGQVTYLFLLK